ncbi:MAG: hypothetical protein HQK50_16860 [Oligoflexia bacterium]|nr:hypothetical protein [Oligoflexia bacterium]MBF0367250.1 hypothetical protein [Oligoflexia bacterium]
MSKARTIRFNDKLDVMVDRYSKSNGLKVNQLVNIAVKKFISEPNSIELEPVTVAAKKESWNKSTKKAFKKHKKAMDELSK